MDTNALYYTFSTIAQTLGGAIALLGAFVFYRLQGLNASIAHIVTQQILQHDFGQTRHTLDELHARGKHDDFLEQVRLSSASVGPEHLRIPIARLDELVTAKSSLLTGFRFSLTLTVALITLSVAFLACVPSIVRSYCLAVSLLAIGVTAFLGCLLTYARLLLRDLT